MASIIICIIIISSFSMIAVKDNDLLMPVLGSWVKNETGSVIICWGSGMVKTCLSLLKELVSRFIRGPMSVLQILKFLAYPKSSLDHLRFLLPHHSPQNVSHQGGYHITVFQA